MVGLILAGAGSVVILSQFLDEKEGNRLHAYQDTGDIWTICRGLTRVEGKAVHPGMTLTAQQCDRFNQRAAEEAIDWVRRHVRAPLTEPQIAGIASFCPYNIGPAKCFPSTFLRRLNAGDLKGACAEIKRWIRDGGKDCRVRVNNCYGQISRRDQEAALACWGIK